MIPVGGLCDRVELQPAPQTTFRSAGLPIDCPDSENLCLKACRLMQRRYGAGDVRLTLDKRVPFGAGLGGGSSDATAVIVGMDELFGLRLSEAELIAAAAELGSDTAFFLAPHAAAVHRPRGGDDPVSARSGRDAARDRQARRARVHARGLCGRDAPRARYAAGGAAPPAAERVAGVRDQRLRTLGLRRASGRSRGEGGAYARRGVLRLDVGQRLRGVRPLSGRGGPAAAERESLRRFGPFVFGM